MVKTVLICGQTDAGKSTILGNLIYKYGFFDEISNKSEIRTLLKNLDSSASNDKYSKLMDYFINGIEEEGKNKTKTKECNGCLVTCNDQQYMLVDTPGHMIYIRAMIEGLFSYNVHIVTLVISAMPDEFNMSFSKGTVKQDLKLARATGCTNLLLLFNKCDCPEASEAYAKGNIVSIIEKYAKRLRFDTVKCLDVSGLTSLNIENIITTLDTFPNNDKVVDVVNNTISNNKILFNATIFPPDEADEVIVNELISPGFSLIVHMMTNVLNDDIGVGERTGTYIEMEAQVDAIFRKHPETGKLSKVMFITGKDVMKYFIGVKFPTAISVNEHERCVFRVSQKTRSRTIGYGIVTRASRS